MKYDPADIEPGWQRYWEEHATFRTPNPGEPANGKLDPAAPKFYVLDMFPYPSGVGLHVGHPLGYIATDITARFMRMRGFNVLHPMGYDAFGLPAEQYAVEHNVHPRITTQQNIDNMTRQLRRLGLGYDWSRLLATTDPGYYRWTQWIFLQLYESYFDPAEKKAKPIAELLQRLEGEDYVISPDGDLIWAGIDEDLHALAGGTVGAIRWHELTPDEQRDLLDRHRLAYLDEVPVNWCPQLGTVLANEEVTADGRSERGNFPVVRRPLRQWMLRITAYADRLLDDLELVDWPEPIRLMQRNWIGRSVGARVDFALDADAERGSASGASGIDDQIIEVFTTRPDTLFGASYMVLAPEHPLVEAVTTPEQRDAVTGYRREAAGKSDIDRQAEAKTKSGVFTGGYAINPVNEQRIPIWIADYVLMGYGTGAIMAVPAHDERDFAFAQGHDLPIIPVIEPAGGEQTSNRSREVKTSDHVFTGEGFAIHSEHGDLSLDGLTTADAKHRVIAWLEDHALGRATVQLKLRDWLFSRQRYWGEPFPILHELDGPPPRARRTGIVRAVPQEDLPVELPEMEDFRPRATNDPDAPPRPPLGRAPDDWQYVQLDGIWYQRELNTMPQWAGSCWYYLRYLDPDNQERFVGNEAERYWMGSTSHADAERGSASEASGPPGVDLYVGGAEHAVLHLLYSRFWHKVLFDLGHISTPEPFGRLFNQGYIQAYAYTDARGVYIPAEEVEEVREGEGSEKSEKGSRYLFQGEEVTREFGKMGKSLKNAIAPDEVCDKYGADTLRLYEMYLGPLDQSKVWNTRDIVGSHRFLQRLWRNLVDEDTGETLVAERGPERPLARKTHETIQRVTRAMESLSFNVAIAALIELNNELVALDRVPRWVATTLVTMLGPLAPHIAEELWSRLGHEPSVADADWPAWDESMLVADEVELPVQVNGKVRGKVTVARDADDAAIEAAARGEERVATAIQGKTVRKVIIVPGRMVNIVAS